MLGASKCLFDKSEEQEQPQCGRGWKSYLAGMGLIEPLGFKNTKYAFFFFNQAKAHFLRFLGEGVMQL